MTRRDMLTRSANGFGGLALTSFLAEEAQGKAVNSLAPKPVSYTHLTLPTS